MRNDPKIAESLSPVCLYLDEVQRIVDALSWSPDSEVKIKCGQDWTATAGEDLRNVPSESLVRVQIERESPQPSMDVTLSNLKSSVTCYWPDTEAYRARDTIKPILQRRRRRIEEWRWEALAGMMNFFGLGVGITGLLFLYLADSTRLAWSGVIIVWILVVSAFLMRRRRFTVVEKIKSDEHQSFIKKHNVEVGLLLAVGSLIAAIVMPFAL